MRCFSKTSGELAPLQTNWAAHSEGTNEQKEVPPELAAQDAEVDIDILTGMAEAAAPVAVQVQAFDARLQPLATALRKFVSKADEGKKNPEAAIYGAAMVKKIEDAATQLAELEQSFVPKRDAFNAAHAQLQKRLDDTRAVQQQREQEEAARKQAEAELAAAAKAEADRVKAEQEKAAAVVAEVKAKEEAAAAAAAKAAEEARQKAEAEERSRAAAVERERLLSERRAAEAREASERSSAAERERQAREAADAQKPLAQRCKEQLDAALVELKAGSSPTEVGIALQTLLKFVSNIMSSPHEERFRSIRLQNDVFQKRLGSRPGGLAALRAMGFAPYRTPPAAQLPAGSELKPDEDYLKIEAKAELWPILVQSKAALQEATRQNRLTEPAVPSSAAGGGASGAAAASPFGTFPFGAGAGAGGSPFANLFGAAGGSPAAGAGAGGAGGGGFNPLALMSDPFVQRMMSNPTVMNLAMQQAMGGGAGGAPTPEMQQRLMTEVMSNPDMMSSMMQSPMISSMMSNPAQLMQMRQQMQDAVGNMAGGGAAGANPFASMFGMPPAPPAGSAPGGTPPAGGAVANPFAQFLSMMGAPPAPGAAPGQAPAASPFAMFQAAMAGANNPAAAGATPAPARAGAPAAASAATPATAAPPAVAAPAPAAAAAAAAEEEIDEEALLAEAMQMSMQQDDANKPPAEKKD